MAIRAFDDPTEDPPVPGAPRQLRRRHRRRLLRQLLRQAQRLRVRPERGRQQARSGVDQRGRGTPAGTPSGTGRWPRGRRLDRRVPASRSTSFATVPRTSRSGDCTRGAGSIAPGRGPVATSSRARTARAGCTNLGELHGIENLQPLPAHRAAAAHGRTRHVRPGDARRPRRRHGRARREGRPHAPTSRSTRP